MINYRKMKGMVLSQLRSLKRSQELKAGEQKVTDNTNIVEIHQTMYKEPKQKGRLWHIFRTG